MLARTFAIFSLANLLIAAPPASPGTLQQVIERMDKAAAEFKSMRAHVTYVTHTDILNEDNTETGTAVMKKVRLGEVQGLVDFVTPDKKTITFEKRRVQVYFPKIKTLQIFELDKYGEQVDKFVMIGFGNSGTELAKDYDMTVLGSEAVNGVPAIRVQLMPKAADVRQYVTKVELWIPEEGDPYPLRERISQPSNDYRIASYSDLKINPPLKADELQPKLPAGVKKEYPGK
jgi:outer membrane lipoprotein-sorting protein